MLNGLNFSEWSEQIQFHLGFMNLDLALRFEKPNALTDESTEEDVKFLDDWERSNRLSIMLMRMTLANNIKTTLPSAENAKEFLKNIEDRFKLLFGFISNSLCSYLFSKFNFCF